MRIDVGLPFNGWGRPPHQRRPVAASDRHTSSPLLNSTHQHRVFTVMCAIERKSDTPRFQGSRRKAGSCCLAKYCRISSCSRVCEQCREPYEPQRSSCVLLGACRQHDRRKRLLSVTPRSRPTHRLNHLTIAPGSGTTCAAQRIAIPVRHRSRHRERGPFQNH